MTPPSRFHFPPSWSWFVDEAIPAYVKDRYSPKESWKGKPFSKPDSQFFFKSIRELSELFTDERPKELPTYFRLPKFRSAYLLYFLPLQAAKFMRLFALHQEAIDAALAHGRKAGVLRLVDLGAGPLTGSIAFLIHLLGASREGAGDLPPIEIHAWDLHKGVLDDGEKLAMTLVTHFPRLRDKVKVFKHPQAWSTAPRLLRQPTSLVLMGNVLNESAEQGASEQNALLRLIGNMDGGGLLMLEPAAKHPSQLLSRIRDEILGANSAGELGLNPTPIWGPCAHAQACPLAVGRDWCHFSIPTDIPGKWFREFSLKLGSERHWLKFSYVWRAAGRVEVPTLAEDERLVISDVLMRPGDPTASVLLCEPERPNRYSVPKGAKIHRGDIIAYDPERSFEAMKPKRFRGRDSNDQSGDVED